MTAVEDLQLTLGEQYAVERELGRGGMGAVFLARDVRLHRPVAIKGANATRRDDVLAELGEHMTGVCPQRAAMISRLEEVRLQLVRLTAGIGSPEAVLAALES